MAEIEREEWRQVVGWEGLYEVSSFGVVRSVDRHIHQLNNVGRPHLRLYSGRVIKPKLTQFGYLSYGLCLNGKVTWRFGHALVCEAFHGSRPEGREAAHGNGIRTDNRASNLRWATKVENAHDRIRHGHGNQGEAHHNAKLTSDAVKAIRATIGLRRCGDRTRGLCRKFGISIATFYAVRRGAGGRWKHIGSAALG